MRRAREFWWATFKDGAAQVVEITRDDGVPAWCYFTGTDNFLTPSEMGDLNLISPVIPPCIAGDVAAVTAEHHRDLGVALAKAMIAMFQASFDGGTPLIALRGSDLITPDVQADVERWFLRWEAKHQAGLAAMHLAMDLLREAKAEVA